METFIHQVVAGIATGGVYASLALALVMIYQSTHHINFAQGEIAMFATYMAWTLINAGVPYWLAFICTVLLSFSLGVLIQRIIIRPVENAPVLNIVVVFIGLLVILNSIACWFFTYTIKSLSIAFSQRAAVWFVFHLISRTGLYLRHHDTSAFTLQLFQVHPAGTGHARSSAKPGL